MSNKRKWVVVDCHNNLVWDLKKECGKTFQTYAAARKEAVELAEGEPGGEVLIYEAHTIIWADVKPPQARTAK